MRHSQQSLTLLKSHGIDLDRMHLERACTSTHCVKSLNNTDARDSPGGRFRMCCPCYDRLRADLRDVIEVYSESGHDLAPRRSGLRERVSGSRENGICLDENIVTLRSQAVALLASWVRLVVDERRLAPPRDCAVPSLVNFLDEHTPWLAEHPAGTDFDHEIGVLLHVCRSLLGPTARRLLLGACSRPGCAETLYAVLPGTGPATEPGAAHAYVSCANGHRLPPRDWLLAGRALRPAAGGGR